MPCPLRVQIESVAIIETLTDAVCCSVVITGIARKCFEALKRSSYIEIASVEFGATLLTGEVLYPDPLSLEAGLVQVIKGTAMAALYAGEPTRAVTIRGHIVSEVELNGKVHQPNPTFIPRGFRLHRRHLLRGHDAKVAGLELQQISIEG